jgi:aldose 1-epimerase
VLEQAQSRLAARLDFAAHPELMAGFPFAHVLELTVELTDRRLQVATELRATGEDAVPVAFGFHPYLRLPDVGREQWLLELPVTSQMELDERMLPTGRSKPVWIEPGPLGERTFDDAFDGLVDPPEFAISGGGRRLSVRFDEGYRFAQVYAPERSEFICFEPMTAPGNPFASDRTQLVEAGGSYRARFGIGVTEAV